MKEYLSPIKADKPVYELLVDPSKMRFPATPSFVFRPTTFYLGGIQETSVEFYSGLTILVGRNATNRTSFLQTVMAAFGSENVAIKGNADEAEVERILGDETNTRQLSRRAGSNTTSGQPFLDDAEHIATLVEFLSDYTAYLLVALLPEDAAALVDDYERVTEF